MVLTDTHTHLYYEQDPSTLKALMDRCFKNQVSRLFLPNVDTESMELVFELSDRYPENCFPMLGLHPCNVKDGYEEELKQIASAISSRRIFAIGEIGIDLYWDKSTLPLQKDAFRRQILQAKELDLPIVIHCREAFNEIFEVLEEQRDPKLRGVFHCFTGDLDQARRAIDLGFYLGIGGVLTYKNGGLDKVLEHIDLSDIVLETDSPYLSPVPHRGKPNESSYLVYIAQKLADLKQTPIELVAEITTENSRSIFGI